jgi:hypothetical protein
MASPTSSAAMQHPLIAIFFSFFLVNIIKNANFGERHEAARC